MCPTLVQSVNRQFAFALDHLNKLKLSKRRSRMIICGTLYLALAQRCLKFENRSMITAEARVTSHSDLIEKIAFSPCKEMPDHTQDDLSKCNDLALLLRPLFCMSTTYPPSPFGHHSIAKTTSLTIS